MFKNKPRPIIIIVSLLAVLALASAVSAFIGSRGGGMPGGGMSGNPPSGGNSQGNAAPPTGRNAGPNAPSGNGGPQMSGSGFRGLGINGPVMDYARIGVTVAGIALLVLSAYGLWRQKRWGLNLGMALAVVYLCGAAAGLLMGGPMLNVLRLGVNIIQGVAALPVLAMGVLPSVRDLMS